MHPFGRVQAASLALGFTAAVFDCHRAVVTGAVPTESPVGNRLGSVVLKTPQKCIVFRHFNLPSHDIHVQ